VFEPYRVRIDRRPGQLDTAKDGLARAYDADPELKTFLYLRGDDRHPDKSKPMVPGVPEALGGKFPEIKPVPLPQFAYTPDKRPSVIRDLRQDAREQIGLAKRRVEALHRQLQAVAGLRLHAGLDGLGLVPSVYTLRRAIELADVEEQLAFRKQEAQEAVLHAESLEDAGQKGTPQWEDAARLAYHMQHVVATLEAKRNMLALTQLPLPQDGNARADLERKRLAAKAKFEKAVDDLLSYPDTRYKPRPIEVYPRYSTGRRLAFARWLANRSNPLTARVAMNHIWMRHIGQAIVPTVFDFGRNGRPPSHPALLDWLAAEFMDRGWSMKAMHRLIVTSNTYRMASTPESADLALDRDNTYLWRMPSRRLEAEAVRDSIFFVAGKLDGRMGGPDIPHEQGLTISRRSLYFQHAQEKQVEFLKVFDAAAVTECYRRKESIVPQQALALNNSELVRAHARILAHELAAQSGDATAFTTAAFERVLSRAPTSEELQQCVTFLKDRAQRYTVGKQNPAAEARLRAGESLVHVLLNHNDFVTVR
jgi:hypothetical protein